MTNQTATHELTLTAETDPELTAAPVVSGDTPNCNAVVSQIDISAALKALRPVARENPLNPLQACVLAIAEPGQGTKAGGDYLTFVARDIEREIRVSIGARVSGPQAARYVTARAFADLIDTLDGYDVIQIGLGPKALHVTAGEGRNKSRLLGPPVGPSDLAPSILDPEKAAEDDSPAIVATMPGAALARAIKGVLPASTGGAKGGATVDLIRVTVSEIGINFVATNSYSLASDTVGARVTGPKGPPRVFTLTRDTMALVARLAEPLIDVTAAIGRTSSGRPAWFTMIMPAVNGPKKQG